MIVIDGAELQALARDLAAAGTGIYAPVSRVVNRGAFNVKRQLVAEMSASTHFRSLVRSLNYDVVSTPNAIEAQVGPDKALGGALANVAYFGTSRGGGTVPDPVMALRAEAPRLEQAIVSALGDLL